MTTAPLSCAVIAPTTVRISLPGEISVEISGVDRGLATILAALGAGAVSEDAPVRGTDAAKAYGMVEWYERWADDARRRGLAARYIAQQEARVRHLAEFAGDRTLDAEVVQDWLRELSKTGILHPLSAKGRPCSAKTLNNHLAALRAACRWAVSAGLLASDPTAGVAWSKPKKRKGRVLSAQQAWSIFEFAEQDERSATPRIRHANGRVVVRSPFYRVLMATGMRAGAAAGLRVRDFELTAEPPRIIIPADLDKSDTERSLIISTDDRDYFAEVLAGRAPGELAVKRPHAKVLYADAEAVGIPAKDSQGRGVGLHCFRRWYGSEMDRQGFSLEQIRQRLGHKTIHSTMGYLVRELEEQQGVAEQINLTVRKTSGKTLDSRNRMPDDESAKNDTPYPPASAENRGERSAPVVLRSSTAPTPRGFSRPARVPPPAASRRSDNRSAPQHGAGATGSNPVTLISSEAAAVERLLHRYLDLLTGVPGPSSPEVPREHHPSDPAHQPPPPGEPGAPGREAGP